MAMRLFPTYVWHESKMYNFFCNIRIKKKVILEHIYQICKQFLGSKMEIVWFIEIISNDNVQKIIPVQTSCLFFDNSL